MWVGVLGPTLVRPDGAAAPIALTAAKQRALVAALALHAPAPVAVDVLAAALWGDAVPASVQGSLHSYLSVVRRVLEPDLDPRASSRYVLSSDFGYALDRTGVSLDVEEFVSTVTAVARVIGDAATVVPRLARDQAAVELARLDDALALWRGEPYADVLDDDRVLAERVRLRELRAQADLHRALLRVVLGDPGVVADLESAVRTDPLRERSWTLLAVAHARAGRQPEALAVLDRLRRTWDTELGLELSAPVRELQTAILRGEVEAASSVPAPHADPAVDWPLVGREDEYAALAGVVARARAGSPGFALLVGEAGVGKSRLAAEIVQDARATGMTVLVGRCSQDEDAPPLWPWTNALGQEFVGGSTDHDLERFAIAEAVREHLAGVAARTPVLVLLEDLHWADPSSLRVLRHLLGHLGGSPLAVVATTRPWEPGSALADTAALLTREGGALVAVEGLPADACGSVFAAVAGADLPPEVAAALYTRTDGNPFFVVEFARLASAGTSPTDLLGAMPRSVGAVLDRRLELLPGTTAAAVRTGAVLGREIDLALLAETLGSEELAVLDLLEPALEAAVLQDLGADRFRFSHALLRDAAYDGLTPSRRERVHARAAELLAGRPDARTRAAEIARHWTSAGPRFVAQAWRAEARAGVRALEAHAAEEAVPHFARALEQQAADPAASPRDRYDLLVGHADACRWSTRLVEMMTSADEAIALAAGLSDPHLVVLAAAIENEAAVWPIRPYGEVNGTVVEAMRGSLDLLDGADSEVRARLMVVLAGELYYSGAEEEMTALVESGIAMARRLGDPRVLVEVLQLGFLATWRRAHRRLGLALAAEAAELADAHGLTRAALISRLHLAATRLSTGDVEGLEEEVLSVVETARTERMWHAEVVARSLSLSWSILRDDRAAIGAHLARVGELEPLLSQVHKDDAITGVMTSAPLWDESVPTAEELAFLAAYVEATVLPMGLPYVVLLLRKGMLAEGRETWAQLGWRTPPEDWWTETHLALGAEIALRLGDRDLGSEVYASLAPARGAMVVSGTGPAQGPADAYLALAAAAAGQRELAAEHADRAAVLIEEWRLPQVARWFADLRKTHAF